MKSTKLLLLTLIIVFSSPTIPASAETGFFDDFEYSDDIENHGYSISNGADENLIAEVRNTAAKDGTGGLYMSSTPDGAVLITHNINIEIDENTTVSIDVYGVEITGYIRVNIQGGQGYLSIDYGHGQDDWEEGASIYNSNETFATNEWYHMNRTILDDIEAGLSHPDSPYSEFTPLYVNTITFIQDGDGNTSYVNYFDNLLVSGDYFTYSDTQYTENPYPPPSNNIPLFLIILYILGGLLLLSFAVYKIGWTNICNSINNLFGTQSARKEYICALCDTPNEDRALFCGNCGEKFRGTTLTSPISEIGTTQPNIIYTRVLKPVLSIILILELLFYIFITVILIIFELYIEIEGFIIIVIIITYILGSIYVVVKESNKNKLSIRTILSLNLAGIVVFIVSLAIIFLIFW